MLPSPDTTHILFAHPAYRLRERYELRAPRTRFVQVTDAAALAAALPEVEVLVVSGLWRDELLARATRLRFIQVCAAGIDAFDQAALAARGIGLANASGVNAIAVAEHAMGLLLALTRRIALGRDHQRAAHWRGMVSDLVAREEEVAGKTVVVYGAGTIGTRLARLLSAFEATPIGIRRDVSGDPGPFAALHPPAAFADLAAEADVVVLTCPLTEETRNVVDAGVLGRMREDAYLINVARGGCVDEPALVDALDAGRIAGAGIDVTVEEPLAADSPLWHMDNVMLTSHTAGETRAYEDRVLDILEDNLARLWRGESDLRNAIVEPREGGA